MGDFGTARAVEVGISPGDESYGEPYFYISPSPQLNIDNLPHLPTPGHWHTKGFVGAIATATEVLSMSNISNELPLFIDDAFTIGRKALGF